MHVVKDHKGASLMELLISIAISAIVLSMIMLFIRGAAHGFKRTSNEVNLQMEAQKTINQISNVAMEAVTVDPVDPAEILITSEIRFIFTYNSSVYWTVVLNQDEDKIYMMQETSLNAAKTNPTDDNINLLADYVDMINITKSANGKTAIIDLTFKLGDDEYRVNKKVLMRNAI